MPGWLNKAVFYEIYPQSFRDSNGDGIGDFRGIEEKIPYLKELGVNAVWINPCYDSSFYDAGYDVRDHYKTAERYGTNDDLKHLFDVFHEAGMHVLLDLIPGHMAIDNPWFIESCKDEVNEYTDRFIWRTGGPWGKQYKGIASFLCGISERPGAFAVNCFSTQPAINYGFAEVTEDWQFASDSQVAEESRLMMQDIMSYWLDMGCDGFRVDIAGSLVKEDPGREHTIRLWQKVRAFLDENYPEAALVSEWGNPPEALRAGFHMDFLLHGGPSHYMDLFRTEPYFSAGGRSDLREFIGYYSAAYDATAGNGLICIPSGNHDMIRMRDTLTPDEMKLAFAFLLTMPGCPFIYYGDEIAMRYIHGLKSKEGGYERTGSRTPMQWCSGKNLGFSISDETYLPVDKSADAPTVENQKDDPDSIYRVVTDMIALRHKYDDLHGNGELEFISRDGQIPFAYRRGSLVMFFNPLGVPFETATDHEGDVIYKIGNAEIANGKIIMQPQSFLMICE